MFTRIKRFFFGCIWLFSGCIMAWLSFTGFVSLYQSWRAQDWVETPCTLEQVELKFRKSTGRREKAPACRLQVRYSYTQGGQRYTGERYDFWNTRRQKEDGELCMRLLQSNPAPTCYVNPAAPQESVMDRRFNKGQFIMQGLAMGFSPS